MQPTPAASETVSPPRLGEADLWDVTAQEIAPKERITPLEWGRRYRVYSKEGRADRWRAEDTPWAAEILWALSEESPYTRVVVPKGTQLGLTEIGLIWIGQGICTGQSALVIEPTDSVAKRVVRTKFRPMLATTPLLRGVFVGRAADATLHFSAPSVDVIFAGSNSPTNFASVTVPRVMGDEVDRWAAELLKEGDPVDLLENRKAEYGFLGKLFLPSSPTVDDVSLVWREFLQSDQRYFETPCPACGAFQDWRWEDMHWEPGEPEGVRMACRSCGVLSAEHEWKGAWGAGRWVARERSPVRKDTAGFHLSTLYARHGQRTWAQIAQQFEAATKSGLSSRMQVFWNTILGLPWKVAEEAVAADSLKSRCESGYDEGVVPAWAALVTGFVDYQKDRLEAHLWAWGPGMRRVPLTVVEIARLRPDGKTPRDADDLARELRDRVLDVAWRHELGGTLRVEKLAHDAADRPAEVFDVLEHLSKDVNVATVGTDGWGRTTPAAPPRVRDVKSGERVVRTGALVVTVYTAEAKRELYDDLRRPWDGVGTPPDRFVHVPEWAAQRDGFLDGLVAEEIRRSTRGKPKWVKIHQRNEPLDGAVGARVAHWLKKAHRWNARVWAERIAALTVGEGEQAEPETNETPPPSGGGWLKQPTNGWLKR